MKKLLMIIFSLCFIQMFAQEIEGDWSGTISYQGVELQMILHIQKTNDGYQSTMDSPAQNVAGVPIDKTTFENGKLSIEKNEFNMRYSGVYDEESGKIIGELIQSGVQLKLDLAKQGGSKKTNSSSSSIDFTDVLGDWSGVLNVSGTELVLIFHISESEGTLSSILDSPTQNINGIAMDETTFTEEKLKIVASALNAEFTAELNEAKDSLKGNFAQNGMSWDLNLTKEIIEQEPLKRPQEPKEFPYIQEEVKFVNPEGGHSLAGTLTIPQDREFEKVVVLISGSGPQDRNEEVLNHKPFLVLSDHFTKKGIAVLRYDDRGIGESEGDFSSATSKDFAEDVSAAIAFLKSRADMKDKLIGLVGHSEGGMVAPIVASENPNVDFIVLLAGPGIPIQELLLLQQDRIGEVEGAPESIRKTNAKISKQMFKYLKSNIDLDKEKLREGLEELYSNAYDQLSDEEKELIGAKEAFVNGQTRVTSSDWYLYFVRFSPDDFLRKVKCPVLAVNGELDLQVTSKENLEGIRKSLKVAKNKNVTIHEFKGLNHLFQQTKTGAPSEYRSLEETFNYEAMQYISEWIVNLAL